MLPTLATPLAVLLDPSTYSYQLTEVVAFRGDFDQTMRPGEVVNPKGIAYHRRLDRLLVSLSPLSGDYGGRTQVINTIAPDGSRQVFAAGYQMYRAVEAKIVVVPEDGPPLAADLRLMALAMSCSSAKVGTALASTPTACANKMPPPPLR